MSKQSLGHTDVSAGIHSCTVELFIRFPSFQMIGTTSQHQWSWLVYSGLAPLSAPLDLSSCIWCTAACMPCICILCLLCWVSILIIQLNVRVHVFIRNYICNLINIIIVLMIYDCVVNSYTINTCFKISVLLYLEWLEVVFNYIHYSCHAVIVFSSILIFVRIKSHNLLAVFSLLLEVFQGVL